MSPTSTPSMLSILDLDDDCLINIFQFLSIYDLIEAEKVCGTFKATCESVYASKRFHKMRIELVRLRTEYFKDIMTRAGKSLRTFEFSGGYIMDHNVKRVMIDGVTKSCPKLKSLSINYMQFTNELFRQLQHCFTNLTFLDLSRCAINELTLDITLDGEKLKGIKTLKLAGNSEMTGSFFKSMKHVEKLDVSYCFNLSFFEFLQFLKICDNLIELNVSASCQLVTEDRDFLKVVQVHQPRLEKLLMDNCGVARDDEVLSKFESLKLSSFEGRKFGT